VQIEEIIKFKESYNDKLLIDKALTKITDNHIKRHDIWSLFVFGDVKYSFMFDAVVGDLDIARRNGYYIAKN